MCTGTSRGGRCGLGRFTARAARSVATLLSGLLLALPVVGKAQTFTPTAPVPQPSAFLRQLQQYGRQHAGQRSHAPDHTDDGDGVTVAVGPIADGCSRDRHAFGFARLRKDRP